MPYFQQHGQRPQENLLARHMAATDLNSGWATRPCWRDFPGRYAPVAPWSPWRLCFAGHSVGYVDEDLFAVPGGGGAGDGPNGLGRPAPPADHPADVARGHLQPEAHSMARLARAHFDTDGIRFVDDLASEVLEDGARPSRRAPGCKGRSLSLLGRPSRPFWRASGASGWPPSGRRRPGCAGPGRSAAPLPGASASPGLL